MVLRVSLSLVTRLMAAREDAMTEPSAVAAHAPACRTVAHAASVPRWLSSKNDAMDWPVRFPAEMSAGTISVRCYDPDDAADLFEALADERVWEHMSRGVPLDAAALDEIIRARIADGCRETFTVRRGGRAVGITSVDFDPDDPAGAEIGGTLLDPGVWGTGVNTAVKRLLLAVIFRHNAQWVQLRTDERNARSAAAIRKLGATELGTRQESHVRRDGTRRQSLIFRLDRPGTGLPPRT
jgi:N-acetyltransferase